MNTPQVVSEHKLIDSWSPRLEEERHMKKFPSETEETHKRINQVTRSGQRDFRFTREEGKLLDVLHCRCTSLWRNDSQGLSRVLQGCKNLLLCEKDFGLLTSQDGGRMLA
ncbi:hypothetical protein YC2023_075985 [Brassica napus]